MELIITKLSPSAKLPTKAHDTDMGVDLYSSINATIQPKETYLLPTGIGCFFPKGYGAFIKDRSSMAVKGIFTGGGVIDEEYTGEIKIVLRNDSDTQYVIWAGEKVAQMVLIKTPALTITEIEASKFEELKDGKARGDKGFGSSGS